MGIPSLEEIDLELAAALDELEQALDLLQPHQEHAGAGMHKALRLVAKAVRQAKDRLEPLQKEISGNR